jgi:hypothetical protein
MAVRRMAMTTIEERNARHMRKEQILRRVLANEDLMRQIETSLEALKRGEKGVPFREIRREPNDH